MSSQAAAPENAIAQIEDGETTHYICQSGNELVERDFDGELGPPELLGTAKLGTPGTYVLLGEKRAFYCLNENDVLQDFYFDDNTGEWTPGKLAAIEAMAAPDAEISATRTTDGSTYVFFQNATGDIQSLHTIDHGEKWQSANEIPPTQAVPSSSLFAITVQNIIHVFYTHEDKFIHELVFHNGKWTDKIVASSNTDSQKTCIVATTSGVGEKFALQFTNVEGQVYAIFDGELTLMGQYINGVFQKDKGAEGWNSRGPRMVCRYPPPKRRRWWW
ncbi:hypothetical protein BGZ60DRAFT_411120 [Tricladium varicosporioides]|nr:hypothetical protein BGZ60DRAFT_411120 [Hymenoscyphus varicosporioides]